MPAPNLSFTYTGNKISGQEGYDHISVTFQADVPYVSFECRATKEGESYGVGIGQLIASFSHTPANTERTFEVYDSHLLNGEGSYRISLFAQSEDGGWNDNHSFIPSGSSALITVDNQNFLCER